jgi:hypothetical protein
MSVPSLMTAGKTARTQGEDMSDDTKTFYADAGKGDRPRGTGWKSYYDNFDAIFGKKDTASEAVQVDKLSDVGDKDVGIIVTGNIECDPNVVWKLDADGSIVKESGCSALSDGQEANVG